MRFKVGDEVQIKSKEWLLRHSSKYHYIGVSKEMITFSDKFLKIEGISTAGVQGSRFEKDEIIYYINGWWFHGKMLRNARLVKIKQLNKISNGFK